MFAQEVGTVLFVSAGLWCIVVHSVRIAVFGNPLYGLLSRAETETIVRIDRLAAGEDVVVSEVEVHFIRRLSRLTMLEAGALVLEIVLLSYLYFAHTMGWLSMGLLIKNLALVAVSFAVARSHDRETFLASLRQLSAWMVWSERLSAVASAAGCLILFLAVNELVP